MNIAPTHPDLIICITPLARSTMNIRYRLAFCYSRTRHILHSARFIVSFSFRPINQSHYHPVSPPSASSFFRKCRSHGQDVYLVSFLSALSLSSLPSSLSVSCLTYILALLVCPSHSALVRDSLFFRPVVVVVVCHLVFGSQSSSSLPPWLMGLVHPYPVFCSLSSIGSNHHRRHFLVCFLDHRSPATMHSKSQVNSTITNDLAWLGALDLRDTS